MKNRELLERIERLERRVSELEVENVDLRSRLAGQNWIYPVYALPESEPQTSEYRDIVYSDITTGFNAWAFQPTVTG